MSNKITFTREEMLAMAADRSCKKIEKDNTLEHYGVKGMEWGVRNYQRYYPRDGQQGKGVLRGEALANARAVGDTAYVTKKTGSSSAGAARIANAEKAVQAARDKMNDKSPSKKYDVPKAEKKDYTDLINSMNKEKKKTKTGGSSSKSKLTAAQKAAKEKEAAEKKAASELAKKEKAEAKAIRDKEAAEKKAAAELVKKEKEEAKAIRDKEKAEAKVIYDKEQAEKKAAAEVDKIAREKEKAEKQAVMELQQLEQEIALQERRIRTQIINEENEKALTPAQKASRDELEAKVKAKMLEETEFDEKRQRVEELKNKLSLGHSMTREEALMMSAIRSVETINREILAHYGIKRKEG